MTKIYLFESTKLPNITNFRPYNFKYGISDTIRDALQDKY